MRRSFRFLGKFSQAFYAGAKYIIVLKLNCNLLPRATKAATATGARPT